MTTQKPTDVLLVAEMKLYAYTETFRHHHTVWVGTNIYQLPFSLHCKIVFTYKRTCNMIPWKWVILNSCTSSVMFPSMLHYHVRYVVQLRHISVKYNNVAHDLILFDCSATHLFFVLFCLLRLKVDFC